MSKRKVQDESELDTSADGQVRYTEKRRRVDPLKWKTDEGALSPILLVAELLLHRFFVVTLPFWLLVSDFLMQRCHLTPKVASAVAVSGDQLKAALIEGPDGWDLSAVPHQKQSAVRSAGMELIDPLMPKVSLLSNKSIVSLPSNKFIAQV